MATFDSKVLNEHGTTNGPIADGVEDLVSKMMQKVQILIEHEQLNVADIYLLESHVSSLVHIHFSEIRLHKQMEKRKNK